MSLEQSLIYNRIGIRKEYDHLRPLATVIFLAKARNWAKRTDLQITGSRLPAYGAAILVTMHVDEHDGYRMGVIGADYVEQVDGEQTLGRLMRGVVKYTLLHPFAKEAPEVRQATGKNDEYNSDSLWTKLKQSVTVAPVLSGVGAIGIKRGEADRIALTTIDRALRSELVGLSLPGTRIEDGTIQEIQQGPAFLLSTHPDIPYYLVAISTEPNVVNIAGPLTYTEDETGIRAVNRRELTLKLGDQLAEIAIPRVRKAWENGGRELERQKLYPRKIATPKTTTLEV